MYFEWGNYVAQIQINYELFKSVIKNQRGLPVMMSYESFKYSNNA